MQLYDSSDDFFHSRTGKHFSEWKSVLNSLGALQKGHTWIVEFLQKEYQLLPEWAEAVSIRYQREAYM
ncbi:hypothetical protein JXA63_01695 [Candidatus Woesebacteria bacterium]|nr:hypothetical protein [Candidatus Woesebacteria bacterium]